MRTEFLRLLAARYGIAYRAAAVAALVLPPVWTTPLFAQGLEPLRYNNPGLVVDLGVGLWAWPVPCDADGDGDFDLIVSCPDKPSNGVWLFENRQGDTASRKFPVFEPARKLSPTVHYLMPSYVDGRLRVLSPGFEYDDFERTGTAKKVPLPIAANFYKRQWSQSKGPKVRHNQWRHVDYDGDGALDLVTAVEDWSEYGWDDAWSDQGEWKNGPLHGFVILHRNTGTTAEPKYAEPVTLEAAGTPIDIFGCPSPNFEDFDRDGDLDLLCGEFLDGFTYFENVGSRTQPRYAVGVAVKDENGNRLAMDLEMIVPVASDWDRDGDFDLVVGDEDGRVALVENVTRAGSKTPVFKAPHYFQQKADTLKCGALTTPFGFDWEGDGDTDLLSGNTAGYIEFFENLSGPRVGSPTWAAPRRLDVGGKPYRVMAGPNGSVQGPAEAKWGYTTLTVADWDMDGLPDVLFNSIWGRVQWLKNVGTRARPELSGPHPIRVEWPEGSTSPKPDWTWWTPHGKELVTQWRTTPVAYDFTGDGLPDLAVLDPEGTLCLYERQKRDGALVLLPPRKAFLSETGEPLRLAAGPAGKSGRRKLCVTDWDGDGAFDLLLNSANADFLKQVGDGGGNWTFKNAGRLADRNIEGHDVSPAVVDFDGDGVPDFVGGAEDGRFYFLKNPRSQRK